MRLFEEFYLQLIDQGIPEEHAMAAALYALVNQLYYGEGYHKPESLLAAFFWSMTPEGFAFWERLYEMTE